MLDAILDFSIVYALANDLMSYFFRCEQDCNPVNVIAGSIILLFTVTIFAIQIHLAKEHESLKTFIIRSKLRNDAYYLLYQMRMLQPTVYEKRIITDHDKNQITSIVKTIKQIEENLKILRNKLSDNERKKITDAIESVKKRLQYGVNDLKRTPQRFDYMDFSESIKEVSNTLPLIT